MVDDYTVGYGKPPKANQFKPGNQAARKRKGKSGRQALSMPEIIDKVLRTRRKVQRGNQVYSLPVAEILAERLVHAVTNGSPRDLMKIVEMLERYLPASLAAKPESLEVSYHRAEGSTVPLPPARLFEP